MTDPDKAWAALARYLLCDRSLSWDDSTHLYLVIESDHRNLYPMELHPPDPYRPAEDLLCDLLSILTVGQLTHHIEVPEGLSGLALVWEQWFPPQAQMAVFRNRIQAGHPLPPVEGIPGCQRARTALISTAKGQCYQHTQFQGREHIVEPCPLDLAQASPIGAAMDFLVATMTHQPI